MAACCRTIAEIMHWARMFTSRLIIPLTPSRSSDTHWSSDPLCNHRLVVKDALLSGPKFPNAL